MKAAHVSEEAMLCELNAGKVKDTGKTERITETALIMK
jgi:hypothetical protein